jgi:predicted MFS family arabinose efflux permease
MTTPESAGVRWRATLFLATATALNFGDRSAFSVVLAPLQTELKLSNVALGVLGSLFLWSHGLGSPVAGILADRYPRGRLVGFSLFFWSFFILVTGFSTGFGQLSFYRLGLGLSECLFLPAAFALVADYHATATRGKAMSLLSMGAQSGVVLGGTSAGFLALYFGWRSVFFALGAGGIGFAVLSGFFLGHGSTGHALSPKVGTGEALHYLIKVPSYHVILAKQILAEAGTWIFIGWLPLYLLETYHMNLAQAGFAGTFMLQASLIIGIAVGGMMSDSVAAHDPTRRLALLGLSCILSAPFMIVFLMKPGFYRVAASVAVAYFFRGIGTANERPALCEVIPPQYRSTALGVMNAFSTLSGAVGVLLAGVLKSSYGLKAVFASSSVLNLMAGLIILFGVYQYTRSDIARVRELAIPQTSCFRGSLNGRTNVPSAAQSDG